jgi:protein gp37
MSLKKSAGNMYPFVTHTWNPVKGQCPYDCSYCYVKRWGQKQRALRLDQNDLRTDLGRDNYIFVCSGCDLFHPDVPDEWISAIQTHTRRYPLNTYLWHTKNPIRATKTIFPGFMDILCVTVESEINRPEISNAPSSFDRLRALQKWRGRRMVTIEPIMDFEPSVFARMILSRNPEQVNIGADSGRSGLPEPSAEKIEELIGALNPYTKVVLKKNLTRLYKEKCGNDL